MCQQCGHSLEGRARLQCPTHPAITFLLDLAACPSCRFVGCFWFHVMMLGKCIFRAGVEALKEFTKPSLRQPHQAGVGRRVRPRCELMDCEDN